MSSFTSELEYEVLEESGEFGPLYALTAPFNYEVGAKGSGLVVSVPVGFITDMASIPRPMHWMFKPDGPYSKAAIVHDYLYTGGVISRWMADRIFLEAMGVLGVSLHTRLLFYVVVRVAGRVLKKYGTPVT